MTNLIRRDHFDEAAKANWETLVREIGSAVTEVFTASRGAAKTNEGASSGDITLPPGDN